MAGQDVADLFIHGFGTVGKIETSGVFSSVNLVSTFLETRYWRPTPIKPALMVALYYGDASLVDLQCAAGRGQVLLNALGGNARVSFR